MKKPIVWSIAGVDPTGLAGTHVDLETFRHFNLDACSIITAVTASAVELVSSAQIAAQCATLQDSFKPAAIKIGMTGAPSAHESIGNFLANYSGFVVLDPVLASSSGTSLISSSFEDHKNSLIKLFPYLDLITPNLPEAERILGSSLNSYQDIEQGAHELLRLGAKSVLLKGGHVNDPLFSQDYWTNGQESFWLANQRAPQKNYRGTGCTLSSAITSCLALGYGLKDALVIAKMYINRSIRKAEAIDQRTSRLFHSSWPEDQIDMPYLSPQSLTTLPPAFKPCQTGLYPVVDSSLWLETLLPQGVKCVQLRIKNAQYQAPLIRPPGGYLELEEEIKRSVFLAKKYGATLFVNDYWELAIRFGAQGIHLGQDDLLDADLDAIHKSGLYLGISTHCYYEVARAHAINPSYIACGPIYPTTSKIMPFQAQGVENLQRWRRSLDYPLVAIGGINLERLPEICHSGVEGISLISAITQAANPERVTQQFLNQIKELSNE